METLFIGKEIIELDVVDSTNSYLAEKLRNSSCSEGLVVMAYFQSAGKGQRGNEWRSQPGENLTFSIVLKPKFLTVNNHFILSKLISLAICKFLANKISDKVSIKWPNDIYVGRKKIAGILIENQFQGSKIENSVVGIGININQTNFGDLTTATSLKLLTHKEYGLKEILKEIVKYIEGYYLKLKMSSILSIEKEYLENLLFYDEYQKYKINGEEQLGKINGVMPDGKLKIILESGEVKLYDLKEIEFIL